MLITNTFISWNSHWPPQQPQSEARLSCKQGWKPPCQFWPLQPRSWHWGRQGCYECVYWPLSQIRSTWNILKDYNLVSWEARFPWDSGPSGWPSDRPGRFWLCGWGSVLLEHVGTFSGNSLHPGFHHGVKDLYVLLDMDPLPPCQRRGGGHDVALTWDDPQDHDGGWKFGVPFGQEWHQPPQHPGVGPKLSSNGKPGTCALLETLSCGFLPARKAFSTTEFRTCWNIFVIKDGLFTVCHTREGQHSKKYRKKFLWSPVALISKPKNCPNLLSAPCKWGAADWGNSKCFLFRVPHIKVFEIFLPRCVREFESLNITKSHVRQSLYECKFYLWPKTFHI